MRIAMILKLLTCLSLPFMVNADCKPSATKVGGSNGGLKKGQQICSGDLIFSDEFDNLNEDLWNHEHQVDGAGNGEFQQYVNDRSVSYSKDGKLFILPKVIGDGPLHDGFFNPVQSARLTTAGRFNFKYGRMEARAKIPAGDWLWPAIWLMPQDSKYGNWPRSGEIDVLESRGNKNLVVSGKNIGTQLEASTLHWGKSPGENQFQKTHYEKSRGDGFDSDYHNYLVEWTPDYMAFKVDNEEFGRITIPDGGFYQFGQLSGDNPWAGGSKMAPFDQNFYLIVNVAVGGTSGYFPDNASNPGGKPWKNSSPNAARDFWNGNGQWRPTWNEQTTQRALKVEYIKVWAI
ncbi:hypothetical protein WA026_017346 [Henosepilachna vigintioctopunctata]|uniref:GH16 domain-containing protein n=1 Tax=Henosepilachna vigintioctopunctata TaxID=420089 RepID=A0AAW1VGM5_9CUCU